MTSEEIRLTETVVFVYGDRGEAKELIAAYCEQCGLSVEDACRLLISAVLDGGDVTELLKTADCEAPIAPQKAERDFWLETARYARERERAQAQAYRLMMKHHKAREVARFKRQKRIYGGLL